jgi:hypothetical protein
MRAFTFAAGVVCLFAVLLDAFQTIILPRRASGRFRLIQADANLSSVTTGLCL